MVLLIIIPFLNGYFIGNIPYFQTNPTEDDRLDDQDDQEQLRFNESIESMSNKKLSHQQKSDLS